MKIKKKSVGYVFAILLSIGFCVSTLPSATFASTSVYFDAQGPLIDLVGSLQFDILDPITADVSHFTPNFPTGWINFSGGKLVSAFDGIGTASLQSGVIGTFDIDVILGNFELGDQSGNVIANDLYNIIVSGSDYKISDVPIPSALLLLGSGLVGLLGFRRKIKS